GPLLRESREFNLPPNELGWAPRGADGNSPTAVFIRTASDEEANLPDVCGGSSTVDPSSVLVEPFLIEVCVFDPDGAESSTCQWTREMVNDEYMALSAAMVGAAYEMDRFWPELDAAFEDLDIPQESQDAFNDNLLELQQVLM